MSLPGFTIRSGGVDSCAVPNLPTEQPAHHRPSAPSHSSPLSADLLRQFRDVALAALPRNLQGTLAAMRIADLSRALGELEHAAQFYGEAASGDGNMLAAYLAALLRGEPTPSITGAGRLPVPFVRRTNALPETTVDELWDHLERNRENFHPSCVFDKEGRHRTNAKKRDSLRIGADSHLTAIILPHLWEVLADDSTWTRLRVPRFHPERISLEAAVHLDGGKFTAHRDCGAAMPDRRVSFIFYLHREPRTFEGGDLLLHDETGRLPGYTRIDPQHNSMIMFPCSALHEVTPVQAPAGDVLDGRITVHGWLHCSDATFGDSQGSVAKLGYLDDPL